MSEQPAGTTPRLEADEKISHVMIYTLSGIYWGELITKSIIRVSTWLRTNAVPDRITLHNAKGMITTGGQVSPTSYTELHISLSQIQAFHLIPPEQDPIDYDPTEPNRKMEPVLILLSSFQFKGYLRLSTTSTVKKFLDVTHELYTPIYDAEITNLLLPNLGSIKVPYTLIRQETAIFAKR
ncbi:MULTISPECIES: hypothetical protein [Anaerolinea]|uniref:Uncharacterized protein n=1 Tax=Anaerolinea thermophila (strain DSM 14523 / JCM 11388 / NBRC 100420 / UNI-1) TaxID=926569 RepID=E8N5G8_ANATU|nr:MULTISPECIES: hypothetical protein [Anaerolinea]BAJ63682.1 hypothetical protein ANT_16560 [Anaerolinea thermophila UNI-1]